MVTPWSSCEEKILKELDDWTRKAYFEEFDTSEITYKYEYYHIGNIKSVLIDYNHQPITDVGDNTSLQKTLTFSEDKALEDSNKKSSSDSKDSDNISTKKKLDLPDKGNPSSVDPKILVPSRLNEIKVKESKINIDSLKMEGIFNEGTPGQRRTSQRILYNRQKRLSQCENNDPTKRLKSDNLNINLDSKSNSNMVGAGIEPNIFKPVTFSSPKASANDPRLKNRITSQLKDNPVCKMNSTTLKVTLSPSKNKNGIPKLIVANSSAIHPLSDNSSLDAAKIVDKSKAPNLVIKNINDTSRIHSSLGTSKIINKSKTPNLVIKYSDDSSRNVETVECNPSIKGDVDKIIQQKTVKVLLPKRRSEDVPVIQQTSQNNKKQCLDLSKGDEVKENREQLNVKKGKSPVKKVPLSKSKQNSKNAGKTVENSSSRSHNESKVLVREKHKTETGHRKTSPKDKPGTSGIVSDKDLLKVVVSIGKSRIEPNILKKIKEIKSDLTDENVGKPPHISSENENLNNTGHEFRSQPFTDDIESNLAALNGINSDNVVNNDKDESFSKNNDNRNDLRNQQKTSCMSVQNQQNTSFTIMRNEQKTSCTSMRNEQNTRTSLRNEENTSRTSMQNEQTSLCTSLQNGQNTSFTSLRNERKTSCTSMRNEQSTRAPLRNEENTSRTSMQYEQKSSCTSVQNGQNTSCTSMQSEQNTFCTPVQNGNNTSCTPMQNEHEISCTSLQNEQNASCSIETNPSQVQQQSLIQKDKCQKLEASIRVEHDVNQNNVSTLETNSVNCGSTPKSVTVKDILHHGNSISINGESFYLVKIPTENNEIPKTIPGTCITQTIDKTDNNSDHNITQAGSNNVVELDKKKDTERVTGCKNFQGKEKSVLVDKKPIIEIDLTEDLFPEVPDDQFCDIFNSRNVKEESSEPSLQDVCEVVIKEKFRENFNNLYRYINIKKEKDDDDDDVIFVKEINNKLVHEEETLHDYYKEFADIFQFFCFARGTKRCFEVLQMVGIDNGMSVQFKLLQQDLPDQIELNVKKGTKVIQNIKSFMTGISWSRENIRQKIILPVYSIIIEKKPEVTLKSFEDFFFVFLKAKEREKLLDSHKLTTDVPSSSCNQRINENMNNPISNADNSQTPCRNTKPPQVYCIPTDRLKSPPAETFPRSAASGQGIPVPKPPYQPRPTTEIHNYNYSQSSQPKVNLLHPNDLTSNQLSVPWINSSNVHHLQQVRALDKGSQQQFYPPTYQPPVRPPCIPYDSYPVIHRPPPYPSIIPPPPYVTSHPSNQVSFLGSMNQETLKTASERRNPVLQKNNGNVHAGFLQQQQLHAASMKFANGGNHPSSAKSGNSKRTNQQKNPQNVQPLSKTNHLNQPLRHSNIPDVNSSAIEKSTCAHLLHQNNTSLSSVPRTERNITSARILDSENPKDLRVKDTGHHLSNFQKQAESDIFQCAVCTNPATLMCSNCCSIAYCSEICATKDWRNQHFRVCQKLLSSFSNIKNSTTKLQE